jgi:hypothetical protein
MSNQCIRCGAQSTGERCATCIRELAQRYVGTSDSNGAPYCANCGKTPAAHYYKDRCYPNG